MALLNIFKKKKLKKEEVKESASSADAPERRKPTEEPERRKIKTGQGYRILKTPRITEKATDLAEKNQYVFEVYPKANKNELKKAVKDIYGVDTVSVRIINVPRKKRRLGRIEGFRKGYKKAIVKVKEGQKIEVMPR